MSDSDLQRLENDVRTIRAVLGGELPYERVDVLGLLAMGVASLLPLSVGLIGWDSPALLLGSSVPYILVVAAYLTRNYWGAHPSRPCPATKRREYRVGLPIQLLAIPLVIGFHRWAHAAGAPPAMINATVLLFIGIVLAYQGLYEPARRTVLFIGVPCVVVAFAWPFVSYATLWMLLWLSIAVGMISAAGFLRWQLIASSQSRCA